MKPPAGQDGPHPARDPRVTVGLFVGAHLVAVGVIGLAAFWVGSGTTVTPMPTLELAAVRQGPHGGQRDAVAQTVAVARADPSERPPWAESVEVAPPWVRP